MLTKKSLSLSTKRVSGKQAILREKCQSYEGRTKSSTLPEQCPRMNEIVVEKCPQPTCCNDYKNMFLSSHKFLAAIGKQQPAIIDSFNRRRHTTAHTTTVLFAKPIDLSISENIVQQ